MTSTADRCNHMPHNGRSCCGGAGPVGGREGYVRSTGIPASCLRHRHRPGGRPTDESARLHLILHSFVVVVVDSSVVPNIFVGGGRRTARGRAAASRSVFADGALLTRGSHELCAVRGVSIRFGARTRRRGRPVRRETRTTATGR